MPKEQPSDTHEETYLDRAMKSGSGDSTTLDLKAAPEAVAPSIAKILEGAESEVEETDEGEEPENDSETDDTEPADETSEAEPQTLEEYQASFRKLKKQLDDSQREIGRHGQEKGDLRRELAELRTKIDMVTQGKTGGQEEEEEDLEATVLKEVPVLKDMPEAQRKLLLQVVDVVTTQRMKRDKTVQGLTQTIGGIEEQRAKENFAKQIQQAKDEVGEELLEAHKNEVAQLLQETGYKFSVAHALKVVNPDGYYRAAQAKKDAAAKDRLAMQGGIAKASGSGARKAPAKKAPSTVDKGTWFMETMKENLKKFGDG